MLNVREFGAAGNGVANDRVAIQEAIAAAGANGGCVYIPPGSYYLGTSADGPLLPIPYPNVSIVGAGKGCTQLIYSSANKATLEGSGAAIYVTGHDVALSDFSISDTNTGSYGGAGISGIHFQLCDNASVERVGCLNVKGNAAITYVGNGPGNNNNVVIRDCFISGTSVGGYTDGDGINVGEVRNSRILNNTISGVLRHAIEGGGANEDQWIVGNKIDMQGLGHDGITSLSGTRGFVLYNSIVGLAAYMKAIGFSNNLNTVPIKSWKVIGNTAKEQAGGVIGVAFGNLAAGTPASILGPIEIAGNTLVCANAVLIDQGTSFDIHDNEFNLDGNNNVGAVKSSNGNPVIDASDQIRVYHNKVTGITSGKVVGFSGPNWKTYRFKCWGNQIGNTLGLEFSGQIDGHANVAFVPGTIPAGGVSTTQTTAMIGLLPTDRVVGVPDASLSGCEVFAKANVDSFDWRLVNLSGADQTLGSTVFRFTAERR